MRQISERQERDRRLFIGRPAHGVARWSGPILANKTPPSA
jgi:hypothetical protein